MRLSATVLFALLPAILASPVVRDGPVAPLWANGNQIDNSYIVVFKKGISGDEVGSHFDSVASWTSANGDDNGITHVYAPDTTNLAPDANNLPYFGYAGKFSNEALEEIRRSPEVAYVERDQVVTTLEETHGVDDVHAQAMTTQTGAPWGLARVCNREELRLSTYNKYIYDSRGGEGVTAYVIDTGINVNHEEFEGRARWGKTIPRNDRDVDGNGHGTHCAGTVGSRKYGVAKKAQLVAVKVLGTNGSGSMADVIDGVIWAATDAQKLQRAAEAEFRATGTTKHKGSVANMSLGGGKAQSLDDAIEAAVETGLHFAVAAGNDDRDACNYSPASAESAITVGASTLKDERATFSNWGRCVDIFAPGHNILSTWIGGSTATNTISGTSMASPHVAGMLAYVLSLQGTGAFNVSPEGDIQLQEREASLYEQAYPFLPKIARQVLPNPENADAGTVTPNAVSPAALKKAILNLATRGAISDVKGSPNLLLFNNARA